AGAFTAKPNTSEYFSPETSKVIASLRLFDPGGVAVSIVHVLGLALNTVKFVGSGIGVKLNAKFCPDVVFPRIGILGYGNKVA
ncbi:hypothetical protein, partial [Klebsiella pneumoniae]|uniref:hypothetical protein n=1 Tax=Klebsiella pneumoniae TaxID=573 RepID=UPI003EDF0476